MASSVIGALRVNLGLDSAQFIRGSNQAQGALGKLSLKMVAVGAAITAAIGGAAFEFAKMARETINTADEISKAAQAIGIGTEELSRLRYAADLSGVSFEQLQTGVGRLSRNMFDATQGIGTAVRAFDALGINVTNSSGQLRSATEVMGDVADRFANMEDGAEKTALAMQIFGRAGADLIPLLNGGRDGLKELTEEADRFGIVIDEETGRRAELFNDNLARLQGAFGALAAKIAADALPSLIRFTEWLIANQDEILKNVQKFGQFIGGVVEFGQRVAAVSAWVEERFGAISRAISFIINPLSRAVSLLRAFGVLSGGGGGPVSDNPAANALRGLTVQSEAATKSFTSLGSSASGAGGRISSGIGGGARVASAALSTAAREAEDLERRVNALFDRLFPKIAEARKRAEDLELLNNSGRTEEEIRLARLRRLQEGQDDAFVSQGLLNTGPIVDVTKEAEKALDDLAQKSEVQTVRIAQTFADMAQGVVSSLQQLTNGIRGGGFLDVLSGVLGIFTQLGQGGAFGGGIQSFLNRPVPGFANGTNFAPGGLSLVGERGPELVNLPRGAGVMTNREMRNMGGQTVVINNSALADVYVDGRIVQAAPAVANAGAQQAQALAARSGRRRIR